MKTTFTALLLGLLSATSAFAADPVVPGVVKMQDILSAAKPTSPASVKRGDLCKGWGAFDCQRLGNNLTVEAIYQKGWRVVATAHYSEIMNFIFIEEQ
ncbi:MAG TPA: hypothetical protein PLY96_16410 [Chromatiaceae bacterium]|nr:hypothetical protein [Chromatiaceae bacterium]